MGTRKSLAPAEKRIVKEMDEARDLLGEFGLILHGYQPGVTAFLKSNPLARGDGYGGEPISFNFSEWEWLKPILEELRDRRRGKAA